jgi:hypothetical protein
MKRAEGLWVAIANDRKSDPPQCFDRQAPTRSELCGNNLRSTDPGGRVGRIVGSAVSSVTSRSRGVGPLPTGCEIIPVRRKQPCQFSIAANPSEFVNKSCAG